MRLSGRNAIITGASRGFGFEVSKKFVEEGASIIICGRDPEQVSQAVDRLKTYAISKQTIIGLPLDVSIEKDIKKLIDTGIVGLGRIDIVVNNAGVYGPKGLIEEIDSDEWISAISINLLSVFFMCKWILPHMKKNNSGKIINLSGGGATAPLPRISAYAASKAAVVRLTETLAEECKEYSIEINAVAPGALNTRLLEEVLESGPDKVGRAFYEKALKQKSSGGTPLGIGADLCVYLASSESDGITGKLISAPWDPWWNLARYREELKNSDIYTLRRIVEKDRGKTGRRNVKVAIIGCGAIGRKRALALGDHELVIAVDTSLERAQEVAQLKKCSAVSTDYEDALKNKEIDLVLISTTNQFLAKITLAAVKAGKHVLVEKPAGRTPEELIPIIETAERNNVFVKVGFNHRYHPALLKAKELVDSGAIGPLMYIRGRYGHGGRIGYEKEWRAVPEQSGGGELIDQGIHLIDLSRWFLGELEVVKGFAHTYYWDMCVDDNAFLMLKTSDEKVSWLHVSCTEWKNLFSFEIYGRNGKLHIEGLGGSYGVERLYFYKMLATMGPPETTIWEFPFPDASWNHELNDYIKNIELHREPEGNISDAKKALDIVKIVYDSIT